MQISDCARSDARCEANNINWRGAGDGGVSAELTLRVFAPAFQSTRCGDCTSNRFATDEPDCAKVDQWKRTRLVEVGADYIVPHFGQHDQLVGTLFPQ